MDLDVDIPPDLGPVGFIGVGEIASAMVDGLMSGEASEPQIVLSPRGAETSAALAERHDRVRVCADNQEVADESHVLVLAVPDHAAARALDELDIGEGTVLASVVAGVEVGELERHSNQDLAIVRAIPLPAVRERRGLTPVFGADPLGRALFEVLGGTLVVEDESLFAVLSAASATMSAHINYMAVVADWAAAHGVDAADAERFVKSMLAGAYGDIADREEALEVVASEHETPRGLNEQLRESWLDESNRANLRAALDALYERVTRSD